MTGSRRLAILTLMSLLVVAACGGTTPSAVPSSSASPGPSVSPNDSGTPVPDPSCPALDTTYVAPEVELTPQIGWLGMELQVTSLVPAWDPTARFVPEASELDTHGGLLPGGHDMPAELWLFYPDLVPLGTPAILSVRPSLAVGSGPAQPLEISVTETRNTYWLLSLRGVPDVDGPARLEIEVEWRDSCFTYTASGGVDVSLVSTAVTNSCPLDREAFYTQLAEVEFASPLLVGTSEVDLSGQRPIARYLPEGPPGGDGPTPFQVWDRDLPALTGAPGKALAVSEANDRVDLTTMDASWYLRRDVIRSLDRGNPATPSRVFHRAPDPRADGSFRLRLPPDAGRYVVWLAFDFESTCATGVSWSVFTVDIAEPSASPDPSASIEPSPSP